MRILFPALSLLFTASVFASPLAITGPLSPQSQVTHVYDGDTISVAGFGKVRLVLIDTPESTYNQRTADPTELKLGKQAKAFTKSLIEKAGGRVFLEMAPEPKDRYGRTLAWVYLPYIQGTTPWEYQGRQFTSLNYELIRQGWAEVFVVGNRNTRYLAIYREAQARAKRLSLGVWAVYQQVEAAARGLPIRIKCAVYNPPGRDDGREEIWLEVRRPVDLTGWAVGDDDGFVIQLSGHAREGTYVVRNMGRPQLSNKGDTILLWHNGKVVDRFSYTGHRGEERACR